MTSERRVLSDSSHWRSPRGPIAAVAALVLLVAVGRFVTETAPPLVLHRTLAAYVRAPGAPPVLAWPREGQAAVDVEGVGGVASARALPPVPIASVAKIMTAYLVLREHPLTRRRQGFTITITPADVADEQRRVALGESTVSVRAGERITEREALQALLLPSANNIAALLAIHDAGTLAAFVARMNATAHALGMRATTYTDPSGFSPDTISTATDQLRLARVAMREVAFATIVAEPSTVLPIAGPVANFNSLVGTDGYVGIKTGSDGAAGGCLVFAKEITVAGRRLTVLGAVLGQHQGPPIEAALAAARRLGDSLAAAVRVETVLPAGTRVLSASSTDGRHTTALTSAALREIGWGGLKLPVALTVHVTGGGLRAGQRMASVSVAGATRASSAAVSARAVGGPSLGWRLANLL
ncbi:MAG: D-alanyl-D-alanine carboxypeptidase [Solirubrobacterales bacterium]|nr:D-alanyl-D-alanine carboxypeptidase [Solirubrobacterales bacterium]